MLGQMLMGGMNLLDLPASMIRDVVAGENPLDQLANPFGFENRIGGRDVLEKWGVLGQNQEGFDFGDVAGFAADVLLDPFTINSLGRKTLGGFLKGVPSQSPAMAVPSFQPSFGRNPIKWDAPSIAGDVDAVRKSVSLPEVIQGPMTPWQAMMHNRRVNQMLESGAMPAEVARQTKATTIPQSEWIAQDALTSHGSRTSSTLGNELRSAWGGMDEYPPGIFPGDFEPATLYHGTSNPIPWGQIDIDKTSPYNIYGRGLYMSNSPAIGDSYVGKNTNILPRFELSPRLFRNKASEAIEAGQLELRDSEEGEILRRWLSGEEVRSPDGTMLNQEVLLDDISVNPGEYFNTDEIEDLWPKDLGVPSLRGVVDTPWDNLEDVFDQSKIIREHDPQAVTKWMLDTRSPLDLDAPLPGGKEELEDAVRKFAPGDRSVEDEVAWLRRSQGVETSDYASHPVIEGLSGKGIAENVRMYNKDPASWLEAMKDGYIAKKGLTKVSDIQNPQQAVDAAYRNLNKISSSHAYHNGPERMLLHSLLDHYHPTARSGKTLFDTAHRVNDGLYQIKRLLRNDSDPEQLLEAMLTERTKGVLSYDDFERLMNSEIDIHHYTNFKKRVVKINEALQTINDFQKRSSLSRSSAYETAIQHMDDILHSVDVEKGARLMAEMAKTSLDRHIWNSGDNIRRVVDSAMPFTGVPTGVSLYKALNTVWPEGTHDMFRQLGYDALTHTGGNRAGSGDYLHRVFIGLDPSKIYSGHAIAPDPVDVWTLKNVLYGLPTGTVPARAAYAESRSASGM